MLKNKLITSLLLLLMITMSCKKKMSLSEYKYFNNNYSLNCEGYQMELFKEAVYSFEDDINKHFEKKGTKNLSQAYSRFLNLSTYSRLNYSEIVSEHSKEILSILKTEENLWSQSSNGRTLNYNHPIVACITHNLQDKDLQTTFNALLSTNSMSPKLLAEAIKGTAYRSIRDKSLATYVALDLYYANLIDASLESTETN